MFNYASYIWRSGTMRWLVSLTWSVFWLCFVMPVSVFAAERLALVIGNQTYNEKVGALTNPHNDIDVVGAALEKLNFKTTKIKDADFTTLQKAMKSHIAKVRESGPDTINFVYYSGHGAADATTGLNYLIPVDVLDAEDSSLWLNSVELKGDLIDKLSGQAPGATHFVVFDACRNELQLKVKGKKAFEVDGKGFVPIEQGGGILVAYATAAKRTASDSGVGSGPYARALAEELVRPGVEAVMIFRNVELRIWQSIGQRPWWNATGLQQVYLAGNLPVPPTSSTAPIAQPQAEKFAFELERAAEKKTMQTLLQQIGDAGIPSGGLFHSSKKWPKRNIVMCFLDGIRERRAHVASVARQWTLYGEIDFDFGSWDDPRICKPGAERHDVAITLENPGNWAYIGTDSSMAGEDKPTLSLESIGRATLEEVRAGKFNREILHEFGHVLGFDHNWKALSSSSSFSCDAELDWNKIYRELAKQGWSKETVDANLRSKSLPKNVIGAFDKNSVMNWQFPPNFFLRGRESPCYTMPLNELSLRDKLAVFMIFK